MLWGGGEWLSQQLVQISGLPRNPPRPLPSHSHSLCTHSQTTLPCWEAEGAGVGTAFVFHLDKLPPPGPGSAPPVVQPMIPLAPNTSTSSDVLGASGAQPFSFLRSGPACLFTMGFN